MVLLLFMHGVEEYMMHSRRRAKTKLRERVWISGKAMK
jgi:hypothetical protein